MDSDSDSNLDLDDEPHSGPRQFTWSELHRLASEKGSCIVAYEQKVYDVSSFVSRHPGGHYQIMSGAGHDITQLFKSYHKPDTCYRVLSKYYIGDLIDKDKPLFPKQKSKLYDAMKRRVNYHVKRYGLDPKIDYWRFLYYFTAVLLHFVFMYLTVSVFTASQISYYSNILVYYISAGVWGYLIMNIWLTFYHDNLHFTVTHSPFVWRILTFIASCITGHSSYLWHYKHVLGHHIYTNVENYDPDLDSGKNGMWRIQPSVKWSFRYLYQQFYACIIYLVMFNELKIQGIYNMINLKLDRFTINPLTSVQWLEFFGSKLIHVTWNYVLPMHMIPLPFHHIVGMMMLRDLVCCSFTFSLTAFTTHINNQALVIEEHVYKDNKEIGVDWAEHQLSTTIDFCTSSWFWTIFSGFLNHQTAHHLFPGYNPGHYHWITPIVKQTCAEFGVEYNCVDSYVDMLRIHFGYLKKMGSKPGEEENEINKQRESFMKAKTVRFQ